MERTPCRQFEATRASLTILLPLLLFAATSVATNQSKPRAPGNATKSWSIRWQPTVLVNGAPMVFQVNPPTRLESLSGRWLDHEVFFNFDASKKSWYGIAGVSLETHPGTYLLTLKATTSGGKEISFEQKVRVRSAKYPSIAVTVAKQFTEPSPEQLERINQEKTLKQDVFGRVEPEREWSGRFRPPVNARISDVFGTRRTFNGKVQSMHQGLDYSVPPGTPVSALNAGTVSAGAAAFFRRRLRCARPWAGATDALPAPFRDQGKGR